MAAHACCRALPHRPCCLITVEVALGDVRRCIIDPDADGTLPPICGTLNRLEHLARGRRGSFSSRPTRSKGGQARVVDVDVPRHDRQVAVCGPDGRLLGVAARRTTSERAADGRLPSRLDAIKRPFSAAEGAILRGVVSAWRDLAKSFSTFIGSEKTLKLECPTALFSVDPCGFTQKTRKSFFSEQRTGFWCYPFIVCDKRHTGGKGVSEGRGRGRGSRQ